MKVTTKTNSRNAIASKHMKCFVVCANKAAIKTPIFVACDVDPHEAFERAKRFLKVYVQKHGNVGAFLCKGDAQLYWSAA